MREISSEVPYALCHMFNASNLPGSCRLESVLQTNTGLLAGVSSCCRCACMGWDILEAIHSSRHHPVNTPEPLTCMSKSQESTHTQHATDRPRNPR